MLNVWLGFLLERILGDKARYVLAKNKPFMDFLYSAFFYWLIAVMRIYSFICGEIQKQIDILGQSREGFVERFVFYRKIGLSTHFNGFTCKYFQVSTWSQCIHNDHPEKFLWESFIEKTPQSWSHLWLVSTCERKFPFFPQNRKNLSIIWLNK